MEFSATGFDFVLGQNYGAATAWPKFINKSYRRWIDFQVPASRVERVRMQGEVPPRGGGQQPVVGEQPQNQVIVITANTPWVQQLEIWMTPHGFLKAAAANNATAKSQSIGGKKYSVLTFMGQNKAPVNGFINADNLVEKVETRIDNAFFGDMPFEATYTGYRDFGGVKFPGKIVQKQGGHPIFDLDIVSVTPNGAVTIQAPQGRGAATPAGAATGGPTTDSPTEKLGEGIYLILGGYACLAIEFKDHIVVVEGPQSEARATAVIAQARKLIPNKPIRYVVNTHAHIDHSSGLRARCGRCDYPDTSKQQGLSGKSPQRAAHSQPGQDERITEEAEIRYDRHKERCSDGDRVVELCTAGFRSPRTCHPCDDLAESKRLSTRRMRTTHGASDGGDASIHQRPDTAIFVDTD